MADGSIKIDIDVATSKADKQLEDLQKKAKESADQIGDDFDLDVDNLAKRFEKSKRSIEQTNDALTGLENKLKEMKSLQADLSFEESVRSSAIQEQMTLNKQLEEQAISQGQFNRLMKESEQDYNNAVRNSEILARNIKEIGNEEKLRDSIDNKTKTLQNQITSYDMLGNSATKLENRINGAVDKQNKLGKETEENKKSVDKLTDSYRKLNKEKYGSSNTEKETTSEKIKQSKYTGDMTKGVNKGVKSLVKYAGALFGLRAIYSTLRKLSNQWLNSDAQGTSQVQAQINAMSSAMSNILGPVIQWITSLLSTMFAYLNAILGFFFGINLLSKSTAKNTGGMASGIKDANKEMKKFNAQFDKADVMSSNVSDKDRKSVV